jgi:acyl-CoA synthetase (AMP-forming)/AMP-acid ligase II
MSPDRDAEPSMSRVPELPYEPIVPVVVRRAAAEFGDADFVVMPDRRISFRDAEAASRRMAKELLAAGVGKGTRVGIQLPTGPEWAVAWIALGRVGALAMPFSTLYRAAELQTAVRLGDVDTLLSAPTMLGKDHEPYLEDAVPGLASEAGAPYRIAAIPYLRSIWLLGGSERRWARPFSISATRADEAIGGVDDALLEAVEAEVTPADLLVAVFTSGTTAAPKAVLHTHGAVLRKTAPVSDAGLNASFPGRVLSLMPFFWIGGLQSMAGALQSGAAVLTLERLDAAVAIDMATRERATSIQGNPTALQSLLGGRDGVNLDSLHPLHQRPWERDPNLRGDTRNALGMTETIGVWASVDGFESRVVDPETGADVGAGETGEFLVRGYSLMQGLYKREREEVFTSDGYYRTGDLGHVEDGFVYCEGRLGSMIKSKGANVAPAEVEVALNGFPEVRVSFVVGLPHDEYGQVVAAAVVAHEGQIVDVDALLAHARTRLSSYKVPTFVEIVDDSEIEWLPSGKANTRAIAALLAERTSER